jgi:hypothetical protein
MDADMQNTLISALETELTNGTRAKIKPGLPMSATNSKEPGEV